MDDVHWFYCFTLSYPSLSGTRKGLFIRFPTTAGWGSVDLTASLRALIELGQDTLDCDEIFVAVNKNPEELENLVHTLLYVGFEIYEPPFPFDDDSYLTLKLDAE